MLTVKNEVPSRFYYQAYLINIRDGDVFRGMLNGTTKEGTYIILSIKTTRFLFKVNEEFGITGDLDIGAYEYVQYYQPLNATLTLTSREES